MNKRIIRKKLKNAKEILDIIIKSINVNGKHLKISSVYEILESKKQMLSLWRELHKEMIDIVKCYIDLNDMVCYIKHVLFIGWDTTKSKYVEPSIKELMLYINTTNDGRCCPSKIIFL